MLKRNVVFILCAGLFVAGVLAVKSMHLGGYSEAAHAAAISPAAGIVGDIDDISRNSRKIASSLRDDPKNLLELTSADAGFIFGESDFVRADMPTVIWQYRTDACVLDIYFRARTEDKLGKVVHYEVRGRGADEESVDAGACLKGMMRYSSQLVDVRALYNSVIR